MDTFTVEVKNKYGDLKSTRKFPTMADAVFFCWQVDCFGKTLKAQILGEISWRNADLSAYEHDMVEWVRFAALCGPLEIRLEHLPEIDPKCIVAYASTGQRAGYIQPLIGTMAVACVLDWRKIRVNNMGFTEQDEWIMNYEESKDAS